MSNHDKMILIKEWTDKFLEYGNIVSEDNLLGLSKAKFDKKGIRDGNFIFGVMKIIGLKAEYNAISNKIVLLNSSEKPEYFVFQCLYLPYSFLGNHSIEKRLSPYPYVRRPVIMEERDKDGNFEVELPSFLINEPFEENGNFENELIYSLLDEAFEETDFDNLLGLSKAKFDEKGIKDGNFIFSVMKLIGLKAKYNAISNKVVLLKSSEMPEYFVFQNLYLPYSFDERRSIEKRLSPYPYVRQPKIMEERDKDGNFEIELPSILINEAFEEVD